MNDGSVARECRGPGVVEQGATRIDEDLLGRVRAARQHQGLGMPRGVMPTEPCSAAVAVLLDNVIATWGCTGASEEACRAVLRSCYRAEALAQRGQPITGPDPFGRD